MVQTVEISGNFDKQSGAGAVAGKLFFTLSRRDYDGPTIIEPVEQVIELDDAGAFANLRLWANDRGRSNSRYSVEFQASGTARKEIIVDNLFVPEAGAPHQLSDLILAASLAGPGSVDRLVPISAVDYDAKLGAGTLQDGLYLVEGV